MSRYLDLILKVILVLMVVTGIIRFYYIWTLITKRDKSSNFIARDREGDIGILFIFFLVINKPIFDRFKYSYQPLLRHFYSIIVVMFVVYCFMQITQLIILTDKKLYTPELVLGIDEIVDYHVKKHMQGYKFNVYYKKNNKERDISFITGKKQKEVLMEKLRKLNVNIV